MVMTREGTYKKVSPCDSDPDRHFNFICSNSIESERLIRIINGLNMAMQSYLFFTENLKKKSFRAIAFLIRFGNISLDMAINTYKFISQFHDKFTWLNVKKNSPFCFDLFVFKIYQCGCLPKMHSEHFMWIN